MIDKFSYKMHLPDLIDYRTVFVSMIEMRALR